MSRIFSCFVVAFAGLSSAHSVFSDLDKNELVEREGMVTLPDFFENKSQDWFLYFTGKSDCVPCIELIKEWEIFQTNLGDQSPHIKLGYADCMDQQSAGMCKYFGLQTVPTVIRVTNSEYYFMPGTYEKNADNLVKFMQEDYGEAFIQGPLPESMDGGWDNFGMKFMRASQQIVEENGRGLKMISGMQPPRIIVIPFSIAFIAVPLYLMVSLCSTLMENLSQGAKKSAEKTRENIEAELRTQERRNAQLKAMYGKDQKSNKKKK